MGIVFRISKQMEIAPHEQIPIQGRQGTSQAPPQSKILNKRGLLLRLNKQKYRKG